MQPHAPSYYAATANLELDLPALDGEFLAEGVPSLLFSRL